MHKTNSEAALLSAVLAATAISGQMPPMNFGYGVPSRRTKWRGHRPVNRTKRNARNAMAKDSRRRNR